ncbi:MAG: MBL fold metallo-hydrolase [Clostridia bacterium]|nr:MBL fold metallo-hydrolase [Clostridia bacterium]
MRLKLFVSPDMGENCYFVIDENTNEAIVIDPGAMAEKLKNVIKNEKYNIKAICLTHSHFDHAGAAEELREYTNAPVFICEGEEIVAESSVYNLSQMFGEPFTVPYDRVLKDGDVFDFGNLSFKVLLTPGHTPGGCCYYFEKEGVVFSGDTLFFASVGRTDFPGGDGKALIESIKNKIFTLPKETLVYTGHGKNTTVEYEIANNVFCR